MILQGDCIEQMEKMANNSIDAIITDPPYGLEFMGKDWDKGVPGQHFWKEMLRILKPGGFLLSFSGTRTYHRLGVNIEDAGFEIRDCIMWIYGSGFPKSLNIGKQIDKLQGNEREKVGVARQGRKPEKDWGMKPDGEITKGNSEWEGWGTALKPAHEPIVVARKPLSEKNVALNVLKWRTGGININDCRIGTEIRINPQAGFIRRGRTDEEVFGEVDKNKPEGKVDVKGRFPANIILDEEAGEMLGEPSRFFYCAKASKSERNYGCEDLNGKPVAWSNQAKAELKRGNEDFSDGERKHNKIDILKNNHPTVKPIKLMEYLIKLITKERAVVLDPFLGSGTTGIACVKLGRGFIGIEKEEEYVKIAEARIKPFLAQQQLLIKLKGKENV